MVYRSEHPEGTYHTVCLQNCETFMDWNSEISNEEVLVTLFEIIVRHSDPAWLMAAMLNE